MLESNIVLSAVVVIDKSSLAIGQCWHPFISKVEHSSHGYWKE